MRQCQDLEPLVESHHCNQKNHITDQVDIMKNSPKPKAKHSDAKQDKELFGKMMKKEVPKMKKAMKGCK